MKPTYLYIKQHKTTGMLYFGKTISNPITYKGSGLHWNSHINKHGKSLVDTIWFCLYNDVDTLTEQAKLLSEIMDVTDSPNWANIKDENGLDGGTPGFATYVDKDGNHHYIKTDSPRIKDEGLVGRRTGTTMSEEHKNKMRGDRIVTLYFKGFGDRSKQLRIRDNDHEKILSEHLENGWQYEFCQEYLDTLENTRIDVKNAKTVKIKDIMTNSCSYYYPQSGMLYGRIPKDSPIIKELGLIHIRSKKQKEQLKIAVKCAHEALLGTNICNNGKEEMRYKDVLPEGCVVGRLPRSVEHDMNQRTATSKAIKDSVTWNDGTKNYRLSKDMVPKEGWVRGMAPQKQRIFNYTDGITWIQCKKGDPIPEGFKKSKKT